MNKIEKIIDLFAPNEVVIADNCIFDGSKKYKSINDVRSACFYAFGSSKITNKNTILIVDGEYLTNCLTVITEAWFQKTNLIVIALYNSLYDINIHYLDRCSVYNKVLLENDIDDLRNELIENSKLIGPKIINILRENKITEKYNDYSSILKVLESNFFSGNKIYLYNCKDSNFKFNLDINNIDKKYKYGIISKYLGLTIANKDKNSLLICNEECLKIDSNILNNRNINDKFKVIVIGDIENEKKWILSNNIDYFSCKNIDDTKIIEFLNNNHASILSLNVEVN